MIGGAPVAHVVVGPSEHGVIRHALGVARAVGQPVVRLAAADSPVDLPPTVGLVHLHVTDKLYGRPPAAAADAFVRLLGRLGRPAVVSLHDIPHADPSATAARGVCYRVIADAAATVVVSCPTERDRLRALGTPTPIEVVPLPVPPAARCGAALPIDRRIGVLGFVYPDKGHEAAIDAAARHGVGVVAIGRCSDGHGDLAARLTAYAVERGTTLEITGFLADDDLVRRARSVVVPFVGARRTSASASLRTWIGAGRRPIVVANEHTEHSARQLGEHMTLCDDSPAGIASAVRAVLVDPASTWARSAIPEECTLRGVAAATTAVQRRVLDGARR